MCGVKIIKDTKLETGAHVNCLYVRNDRKKVILIHLTSLYILMNLNLFSLTSFIIIIHQKSFNSL